MASPGLFASSRTKSMHFVLTLIVITGVFLSSGLAKKDDVPEADKWKKKDVRDFSDADMERLFDQWEEADEDELEEDELPEWKRPQPKIDLSKINPNDPESMLKATKKGKTLMMFATVSGNPSEKETEEVTKIWQSSLFNANIETQRYVVGSDRVLFLLKDGAVSWEIKDFLVDQDRCEVVTIEGQDFPGKGAKKKSGDTMEDKKKNTGEKKKKSQKVKKTRQDDSKVEKKKDEL